jgi:hypothetical protein
MQESVSLKEGGLNIGKATHHQVTKKLIDEGDSRKLQYDVKPSFINDPALSSITDAHPSEERKTPD